MGRSTGQTTAEGLLLTHRVSGNTNDVYVTRESSASSQRSTTILDLLEASVMRVHCGAWVPSTGQA